MSYQNIVNLLKSSHALENIIVKGWLRTKRDSRDLFFLEINDGSCLNNLQVILNKDLAKNINFNTGVALVVEGDLLASQGKGQLWELVAKKITSMGMVEPENYPLQKKRHSDEFLREIAHLRVRSNKYGAMFRLRSEAAWAVHSFFKEKGYFYVHTPIITGSDCEGAGEMFRVTTLSANKAHNDYKEDFFGKFSALTVSGQLEAEMMALALGKVYTFGPTFRAENSNTARHASEFWMIEPEAVFMDLNDNMNLAEDMVKYLVNYTLENCHEDLSLFDKYVEPDLFKRLENLRSESYARISYAEAIDLLTESMEQFQFKVEYGIDLQTEHERFLCETYFKKPTIVYNYPTAIKPFYMRLSDDKQTVAAMDLLVPKVGELIGGSQREERLDVLEMRLKETGLNSADYWWYLDSRRWGSAPHSGFGMGFERFLMMLTGVTNIRDVIAFPRTPKNLDF